MKKMLRDSRSLATGPALLVASLLLVSCGSVFDSQDDETSHQVAGSAFTLRHTWAFYLAIDPYRSVRENRLREQIERMRRKREGKEVPPEPSAGERIKQLAKEFRAKAEAWRKKHLNSGQSRNFITLYNTYIRLHDDALAGMIAGHRVETSGGLRAKVAELSVRPATIRWESGRVSTSASGMEITAEIQAESPANAEPGERSLRILFPKLAEFCREFECAFRKDGWRTVSVGAIPVQLHGSRFASLRARGGVVWRRYRLYVIAVSVIVIALFLRSRLGRRREAD